MSTVQNAKRRIFCSDPEKDASPLDHAPPSAPFMLGGIMAKITVYLSPKKLSPSAGARKVPHQA
jgi:hypothetical protein